jgi:3-dehydroquinate dehydratase-1
MECELTLTPRIAHGTRRRMARAMTVGGMPLGPRPVVVAAGGEADLDALEAADGAGIIELRADLFETPDPGRVEAALVRLRGAHRPIVLTARAAAEGGRPMPEEMRAELYRVALPHVAAIDVEISSEALVVELLPRARAAGCTTILSFHDFATTPPRQVLLALVDRARALGADLPKLATRTVTLDDLRTLMEVTVAAQGEGIVTLGMGPFGPLSRLVLPAAGSLLTYGAAGAGTAPGQLPVAELAALVSRLFPS